MLDSKIPYLDGKNNNSNRFTVKLLNALMCKVANLKCNSCIADYWLYLNTLQMIFINN